MGQAGTKHRIGLVGTFEPFEAALDVRRKPVGGRCLEGNVRPADGVAADRSGDYLQGIYFSGAPLGHQNGFHAASSAREQGGLLAEQGSGQWSRAEVDPFVLFVLFPYIVLTLQQITEAALHLSERERLGVTAAFWKSLGGNDEALADIQALSRAHELDSGQVQPQTHAEVFGNARASLG